MWPNFAPRGHLGVPWCHKCCRASALAACGGWGGDTGCHFPGLPAAVCHRPGSDSVGPRPTGWSWAVLGSHGAERHPGAPMGQRLPAQVEPRPAQVRAAPAAAPGPPPWSPCAPGAPRRWQPGSEVRPRLTSGSGVGCPQPGDMWLGVAVLPVPHPLPGRGIPCMAGGGGKGSGRSHRLG